MFEDSKASGFLGAGIKVSTKKKIFVKVDTKHDVYSVLSRFNFAGPYVTP